MNAKVTLRVTSNKSKRTFTIYKYANGKLILKYRTIPFSKDEFEHRKWFDTENDWKDFLRYSPDYSIVY